MTAVTKTLIFFAMILISQSIEDPESGICNCSLKLTSIKYIGDNKYFLNLSNDRPQYKDIVTNLTYKSELANSWQQVLDFKTEKGGIKMEEEFEEGKGYLLNLTYGYNEQCSYCSSDLFLIAPGMCNCSLKLISVEFIGDNKYFVKLSNDRPQYEDNITNIFYKSELAESWEQVLAVKVVNDGVVIMEGDLNFEEGKRYQLNMTYGYNEQCSSCNSSLVFIAPEKGMKNISIFVGIVALVSLMIIMICFYNIRSKCIYRFIQEIKRFLNNTRMVELQASRSAQEAVNILYTPLDLQTIKRSSVHDHFEIPRESLEIKVLLDEGEFGQVYYAKAHGLFGRRGYSLVAVKQLKDDAEKTQMGDFLTEIEFLKKVGKHRNVVRMLGYVTKFQPYLIVMELVLTGNLKDYLLDLRNIWNLNKEGQYFGSVSDCTYVLIDDKEINKRPIAVEPSDDITCYAHQSLTPPIDEVRDRAEPVLDSNELHNFAYQIACGMKHLEELNITHRDLAARNILITKNKTLKITDFGLSRTGTYININKNRKFPLRWMAIEAIEQLMFNNKTDVWSYGVVLWEIGTLAALPYTKLLCPYVLAYLKTGNRLSKPEICSNELYKLMVQCWKENPDERPNFKDIFKYLSTTERSGYVELKNLHLKYEFPAVSDDLC